MHRVSLVALLLSSLACASAPPSSNEAPAASGSADDKVAAARAQLDELASAWTSYSFSVGRCPQSLDDLTHPPVGAALVNASPIDPWGQPIAYMPASEENASAQLVSAGPDRELLTNDDLKARASCQEP